MPLSGYKYDFYGHVTVFHNSTLPLAQPRLSGGGVVQPGPSKKQMLTPLTPHDHPSCPENRCSQCHHFSRCSVSYQSHLPQTPPTSMEQMSRGFRDNWSRLGHKLIYTKPPQSSTRQADSNGLLRCLTSPWWLNMQTSAWTGRFQSH